VSNHLPCLSAHESAAASEYVSHLHHDLGHELIGLWLFGSRARGESSPDSDIDLLVVLTTVQPEVRWHIWELGSDISLEYDVLLNVHIIDAIRWDQEHRYRGTLWREIERDGILLLPRVSSASAATV
jgi:predicted nucleotidyltransferase